MPYVVAFYGKSCFVLGVVRITLSRTSECVPLRSQRSFLFSFKFLLFLLVVERENTDTCEARWSG